MLVKIVRISAVYRDWPVHLVVENDAGEFLELSLKELQEADYEFDDDAWKQLVEDFRVFYPSYQ